MSNYHVTLLCLCMATIWAFNVDLGSKMVYNSDGGQQWFGFSVALHISQGNGWLLVGAPKARTEQEGVIRGGAVYKCSPSIPRACQIIPFDTSGNDFITIKNVNIATENKTEQWFGATVSSSGGTDKIVACAPRYVHHTNNLRRREPVGKCYVSWSNFTRFKEYSPCKKNEAWGYHRQGSCQAGMSAGISKDGRRLFIGAVGSWFWQGQIFSQNLLDSSDVHNTSEDSKQHDATYMGFSTAVGEFSGDDDADVVIGRPRGANLSGAVLLFNSTLHSLFNISGEQIGSYFGYSLTVVDLNGDKLDDIVVGAPLYSDFHNKDNFETGRVYVYYQTQNHSFNNRESVDGKKNRGRFGLSLASLGDINMDGYEDICVGAPYDGRGIIYIFHGSSTGIIHKPSQIIKAEDINTRVRTFGFSVSGGLDIDFNGYPDLLVGGYESDTAVYLRTNPVVNLKTNLLFHSKNIKLDVKSCIDTVNQVPVTCSLMTVEFKYNGHQLDSKLNIRFKLTLDAEKKHNSRMFFLEEKREREKFDTLEISRGSFASKTYHVYIRHDIRDKLTPFTVELVAELDLKQQYRFRKDLPPVLINNKPAIDLLKVPIDNKCGEDQVCVPDMVLNANLKDEIYIIGQKEKLEMNIYIVNHGEAAYEAEFYFIMSDLVDFVHIIMPEKESYPIQCNGPQSEDLNIVKCDLGNPLPPETVIKFSIQMSAKTIAKGAEVFDFIGIVNSTNPEQNSTIDDNEVLLQVPIRVNSSLSVHGVSSPWTLFFGELDGKKFVKPITEKGIGPKVIHTYTLRNPSLTPILRVGVTILWPLETSANDPLLYLLEQPLIQTGNGTCEHVPYANEMDLTLDAPKQKDNKNGSISSDLQLLEAEALIRRRQISRLKRSADPKASASRTLTPCGRANCIEINCTFYNVNNKPIYIEIPGRVWTSTVSKLRLSALSITSQMIATIVQLPYGVDPSYLGPENSIVTTTAISSIKENNLWIIILAVCLGLFLLIVIMIILWKLGFFKRNRPEQRKMFEKNALDYHTTKADEAFS